jgi:hypothetical protein
LREGGPAGGSDQESQRREIQKKLTVSEESIVAFKLEFPHLSIRQLGIRIWMTVREKASDCCLGLPAGETDG